ncbi:helix-turn-helix domain-containing protein [Actinomadura welshii]
MASSKVGSIGEYIREQRTRAKISLRQLADVSGISNPYLSQIERGLRKPSAEILQQIAKGLRISAEALYVQAGILEDRETDTDVQAAIRDDLLLTERQKQVLLDIYASFLKENEVAGVFPASEQESPEEDAPEAMAPVQEVPEQGVRGRAARARTAREQAMPEQDMPVQDTPEREGREEVG